MSNHIKNDDSLQHSSSNDDIKCEQEDQLDDDQFIDTIINKMKAELSKYYEIIKRKDEYIQQMKDNEAKLKAEIEELKKKLQSIQDSNNEDINNEYSDLKSDDDTNSLRKCSQPQNNEELSTKEQENKVKSVQSKKSCKTKTLQRKQNKKKNQKSRSKKNMNKKNKLPKVHKKDDDDENENEIDQKEEEEEENEMDLKEEEEEKEKEVDQKEEEKEKEVDQKEEEKEKEVDQKEEEKEKEVDQKEEEKEKEVDHKEEEKEKEVDHKEEEKEKEVDHKKEEHPILKNINDLFEEKLDNLMNDYEFRYEVDCDRLVSFKRFANYLHATKNFSDIHIKSLICGLKDCLSNFYAKRNIPLPVFLTN